MSRWRLAIVLGVTGWLTFPGGSAHAQASSCIKIMLEYVGKPLAKAFAEKGAGLAAEYFVTKLKQSQHAGRSDSNANQLTQRDLEELRAIYARNGENECQLRQDLQQAVNNVDYMVPVAPRASLCITLAGSCQVQVPSGSNCACYNAWGAVFPGIAD
jgi:hypothetical protein